MIVISDTSVITALIQIDRVDLLAKVFGSVVIPEKVAAELTISHQFLPPWIRIVAVRDRAAAKRLGERLDEGESEAIALAIELGADYLLMDEKKGRLVARQAGLKLIGVLGLATLGKRMGLVPSVAAVIADLKAHAAFRIGAELEARILREAGEA